MKIRFLYLLFLAALCAVALGSKNGRASQDKKGNTGAPGDETNSNGSPRLCSYCHFGAAGPVAHIDVLDADSNAVTEYLPGQQYIARVMITNSNPNLTGYGFQMIALRDTVNTDIHGFSDPGNNTVNNYKLATIPNGRTYAEHDNISSSNIFNVVWTAPAAGTGPVTFYTATNAVNRNGSTSGDGVSSAQLHLTEGLALAADDPAGDAPRMQIWPNPVARTARLEVQLEQGGEYSMTAFDAAGRIAWQSVQRMAAGANRMEIPVSDWKPGVYYIEMQGGVSCMGIKVVKR